MQTPPANSAREAKSVSRERALPDGIFSSAHRPSAGGPFLKVCPVWSHCLGPSSTCTLFFTRNDTVADWGRA